MNLTILFEYKRDVKEFQKKAYSHCQPEKKGLAFKRHSIVLHVCVIGFNNTTTGGSVNIRLEVNTNHSPMQRNPKRRDKTRLTMYHRVREPLWTGAITHKYRRGQSTGSQDAKDGQKVHTGQYFNAYSSLNCLETDVRSCFQYLLNSSVCRKQGAFLQRAIMRHLCVAAGAFDP